jgi:hypothetical protein
MSESIQLEDFRDGGSGSTVLCYSDSTDSWICGDSRGNVYTLLKDNTKSDIVASDFPITSMALSPENDSCAISVDKCLNIYEFPDCTIENMKLQYAMRKDLDITHTVYEKDGGHM